MTLRWVKIREDVAAEVWKLDKPDADGTGVTTFYRGRRFQQGEGERTKLDEEAKFTRLKDALAWFESHKSK